MKPWLRNLDAILVPFSYSVWNAMLSSGVFDRAFAMALRGDPRCLYALRDAYRQRRLDWILLGRGVTAFDAWAFRRAANVLQLPLLDEMAKFGILATARDPETGITLAHFACEFDVSRRTLPMLRQAGVDFDAWGFHTKAPLDCALEDCNYDLAEALLKLGVDATPLDGVTEDCGELEYLRMLAPTRAP